MFQVTYSRKVDYISAACIMFPRQLYLDVGGFDPEYGLGYYEDTDLAMAIRAKGYTVMYQPLSVVSKLS
jgi:GT2 family glycosyltransferase